jgi:hypothetical protein
MASDSEEMDRVGMSVGTSAAIRKVLAGIDDPDVDARYPNRAHFVSADHPDVGTMTTRALMRGDPVVVVAPDGRETVFTPEQQGVFATAFLLPLTAIHWLRSRRGKDAEVIRLPVGTQIEFRDASGERLPA